MPTLRPNHPSRPPRREQSGGRSVWGLLFGSGEDPTAWSFPLFRLGSSRFRLHWFVPIWLGAELVAWLPHDALGPIHIIAVTCSLLAFAAFREIVRLVVARRLGSEGETTAIWPLGGVTSVGSSGRESLRAEFAGLAAGLLLVPLTIAGVLFAGAELSALTFDPLSPRIAAATLRTPLQVVTWWAYYANSILLLANCLPAAPFDAGRALAAVWRRQWGGLGAARAARLGLTVCAALFVFAAAAGQSRLIIIAAFAALMTFMEFRRAEFLTPELSDQHDPARDTILDPLLDAAPDPHHEPAPATVRHPAVRSAHALPEPPSLDEVLAKISRSGLASLSQAERDVLAAETRRRQHP